MKLVRQEDSFSSGHFNDIPTSFPISDNVVISSKYFLKSSFINNNETIELKWHNCCYYNNDQIFHFHTHVNYDLTELNSTVDIKHLENVVIITYDELKDNFNKRKNEFSILSSIPLIEIPDYKTQEIAHGLQQTLELQIPK